MYKDQCDDFVETQKAEAVSQVMKLIMDLDGSQLKEVRRFMDTLFQLRNRQDRNNEE